MYTKIIYISLRSQRREEHEKRSYNAKVTSYKRFQKLAIKLDLIEKFKKLLIGVTVALMPRL
jgi:hypothetical protein